MNQTEVILQGTLTADGTIQLDEMPSLPPGRVQVVVQAEGWLSYLKRRRAELEASGAGFRRGVDIRQEIETIRGERERADGASREHEWEKPHPENRSC